ncbi:hypothetical protein CWB41_07255 [Methylovirgula ligni]|nr:hypothetical protein CWB41_07255 [Methylovirgula ligni]
MSERRPLNRREHTVERDLILPGGAACFRYFGRLHPRRSSRGGAPVFIERGVYFCRAIGGIENVDLGAYVALQYPDG